MNCRHCGTPLSHAFLDLGFAPPSNAYLTAEDLHKPEVYYPLKVMVCNQCWLVQTVDYTKADTHFTPEYAYFSSTSSSWLEHARHYAKKIIGQITLDNDSYVIEIASNDGYLLKNFIEAGISCLGIEPTDSTAAAAEKLGIPVLREFFCEALGKELAANGKQANLVIGNNVYAHVPNVNDFTRGLKAVLKQGGTITLEFPHLMRLIECAQFDTVYHEHFSYFTLYTVSRIFQSAGLRVWDVEELPTHGGSLRIYGCHQDDPRQTKSTVDSLLKRELGANMQSIDLYTGFQDRADKIKDDVLHFLIQQKRANKSVIAYSAAAKGNTLLNYAGVKPDLLPYICDAASAKQGKFMPGSHIPILSPDIIRNLRPDYVLVLAWNIADEVMKENNCIREWKGQFVTAVPELRLS